MTIRTPAAAASEPGRRGRHASSDVAEAILVAAVEVLDEVGFEALTVEAVAARADVAKTAVYRRWPSKIPLVVEALTRSQPEFVVPDTGDLRSDLIGLWENTVGAGQRSIERLLPIVTVYLTSGDSLMTVLHDRYFQPRLAALRILTARAAARGEIRADADPGLAFDLLFGPLVYRWLRGTPPDDETIGLLTDLALRGLRPANDQH
jgi:AcrR family transcriptional regulator